MIRTIYYILPVYKVIVGDKKVYNPNLLFFNREEAFSYLEKINIKEGRYKYFIDQIEFSIENNKIIFCSHKAYTVRSNHE